MTPPSRGVFGDEPAGAYAARADDCVDMIDERGAGAARAAHDAEHLGECGHCSKDFAQRIDVPRRHLARLEHDRIARD